MNSEPEQLPAVAPACDKENVATKSNESLASFPRVLEETAKEPKCAAESKQANDSQLEDSESPSASPKFWSKKGKKRQRYSTFTRKLWSDDEDEAILALVKAYGIRRWTLISKRLQETYHIHGRSGKQCRER